MMSTCNLRSKIRSRDLDSAFSVIAFRFDSLVANPRGN